MLLMSSLPEGISNAFRAGKSLLSGKLPQSVQTLQDWDVVGGQECGKVYVENDFEPKGALDADQPKTSTFSAPIYNIQDN